MIVQQTNRSWGGNGKEEEQEKWTTPSKGSNPSPIKEQELPNW